MLLTANVTYPRSEIAVRTFFQLSLSNLESASPAFPFFEKEVQQARAFVESNKMIPLLSRRRLLAELEHKQKLGVRPRAM